MWEKILFHRKESEPKIETEKNKKEYEKAKKEAEITTFKEEREKYKFLLSKIEDIAKDKGFKSVELNNLSKEIEVFPKEFTIKFPINLLPILETSIKIHPELTEKAINEIFEHELEHCLLSEKEEEIRKNVWKMPGEELLKIAEKLGISTNQKIGAIRYLVSKNLRESEVELEKVKRLYPENKAEGIARGVIYGDIFYHGVEEGLKIPVHSREFYQYRFAKKLREEEIDEIIAKEKEIRNEFLEKAKIKGRIKN